MPLSATISTGLVKGRFGDRVVAGPNGEKLLIPARGRIDFVGLTPITQFPTADPPVTMLRPTATGIIDSEGYLCTPDATDPSKPGERMVLMQAPNDPDSTVRGWTWRGTPRFVNADGTRVHNSMEPFTFDLPFGDVPFDLVNAVSVPESAGVGTEQVIILAASAQAHAASADAAAEAAAADAKVAREGVAEVAEQVAGKLDADTAAETFQTKTDAEQAATELATAVAEAKAAADATATLVGTDAPTLPLESVVVYGESTTHSGGTDWPGTVLASMLGVPVTNAGVAGQGAADILLRMGAIRPNVALQGGAIPASGPVAVTSINPKTGWRINGSGTFGVTGSIAGVEGSLTHSLVDDTWTFTRATSGQLVPAPPGTPFVRKASLTHPNHRMVLWTGRNNVSDGSLNTAADLVSLAPSALAPRVKKYVMIGVLNGTNEPKGHVRYNAIVAYNQRLAGEYGSLFFDLRRDFIDRGMSIAGLTPTTADTANIAKDAPPPSLMKDDIHPNDAGYRVVARLVAEKLLSLGWVSALNLPETPVEPDPTPDPPLPTAQVLTSDSFNRADTTQGSLGTTDAANGGIAKPWTSEGQLQILSNQVGATTLTATRYATVDVGVSNHYAEVTFAGAVAEGGVAVRFTDSNNTYSARVFSGGTVALDAKVAGTVIPLEQSAAGIIAVGDTLGLEVQGERLRVFKNGVVILERASDTRIVAGTRAGIRSSFSNTGARLDNFKVQDKA